MPRSVPTISGLWFAATMAEYALIIGGIAIVVIAGILILGPAIRDLFDETGDSGQQLPELLSSRLDRRFGATA